jgi:hypothetical protein
MSYRNRMRSLESQRGQALVEYIYVFPILLMLILGAIQFGFIYQTKTTLNYATFTATRAGALNGGSMSKIVDGLTAGMLPLFTHSKGGARGMTLLTDSWKLAYEQMSDSKYTQITIVNPSSATFSAYKSQSEDGTSIPNDNLMYRDAGAIPAGAVVNIQDANLLKIRVTYCYTMAVPIINKLIYNLVVDPILTPAIGNTAADMLASQSGGGSGRCVVADGKYRIPITSEAIVRMQSPFKTNKWTGP